MNTSFNSEHDAEINQPFTHGEVLPSENAGSNIIHSHPASQQYSSWDHYESIENPSAGFAKLAGDQLKEQLHSYASYPEFPVELSNAETRSNSYLSQNQISSSSSSSSNSLSSKNNNNNLPSSITSIQDLKSHFETLNTANESFNNQTSEIQPLNQQHQVQSQILPSQLSPQFDAINTSAGLNHEIFTSNEPFSLSNQQDILNSGFQAYPNAFDASLNSRSYSRSFPCPERLNVAKLIGGINLDNQITTAISDAYHNGEDPVTVSVGASSFPNNLDYQSGFYGIKPPPYNQKNLSNFYDAEKHHQQQSYDQALLQIDQSYSNSNQFPYPYSSIQPQQSHSHISQGFLQNHFQTLDHHLHQHSEANFHVYPQQYLRQEHYENELFYDNQANHHHSCPYSSYPQSQFSNTTPIHPYYRHSFPQAYNMNPQYYQSQTDPTTKIEEPSSFNEESNQVPCSIFNKLKDTKKPQNQAQKIQDGITKKPKTQSRKQSLQTTFQEPARKKSKIISKNSSKLPLSQFQSPAFSFAPCPDSPSLSALGPITLKPRAISLPVTPIKQILKFVSPHLKSTSLDDEEASLRVKLESVELEKPTSAELSSEKDEEDDEDEGDEEDENNNDDEGDQTANNQLLMLTQNKKNVVKNIMSAFKTFVLSRGSKNQIEKIYNGVSDSTEDIDDIQRKFKRYIGSKNFNHYSLRLLILHVNYGPIFKYFLSSCSQEWLENSKIKDTESHQNMIFFFLSCFDDIKIIDTLRRHPKKKCRFS